MYGVQYLDKATLGRAAVLGFIEDNNLSASQYVLPFEIIAFTNIKIGCEYYSSFALLCHGLTCERSNWLGSILYLGYLLFAFP